MVRPKINDFQVWKSSKDLTLGFLQLKKKRLNRVSTRMQMKKKPTWKTKNPWKSLATIF